jgi:glycosyltransferase involved in cell wall biosynthesis
MADSRKVVIVVENSYVPLDTRVLSEAKAVQEMGWEAVVICPFPPEAYVDGKIPKSTPPCEDMDGITVYHFPLRFAERGFTGYFREYLAAMVWIARCAWRVWREGHFDIIQFCNPPDIFFPIAWFYRWRGAHVIFDHHDLFPEALAWRFQGRIGHLLYGAARLTEYLTFRAANTVISTNQSYREIAMTRGRVPESRISVVRNGPVISEFTPVEPVPGLKRGFPYMACYVGVMGPEDGIVEIVSVIRYLVVEQGRRDIYFALIGDGAARPQALAQVSAWGIADVVCMPGLIRDRLLLRQYICTADVCLSPEPYTPLNAHSTFIKIGEYMAMGKPVLAFDLKESRRTAEDAAQFVELGNIPAFGDALAALMDDPARRLRMGERGRQRILNELGWEYQKDRLRQAYRSTLSSRLAHE